MSVEGEGDLLKAFGVPTLLFLPGALFLGLAALLWNGQVLRHPAYPPAAKIDVASLAFIGASVIASFAILSSWAVFSTDFFESYSKTDILGVAVASAVFGVVSYGVMTGLRYFVQSRRTPKEKDSPMEILKKLGRRRCACECPAAPSTGTRT